MDKWLTAEETGTNKDGPAVPARKKSGAPTPTGEGLDDAHQEGAAGVHGDISRCYPGTVADRAIQCNNTVPIRGCGD